MDLKDFIAKNGGEYFPISDPLPLIFKPPKMFRKEDLFIWEEIINVLRKESMPQYAGIINDACVQGDKGFIKAKGIFLNDFGTVIGNFSKIHDIEDKVCVSLVAEDAGKNYWHWIQTSLGKLSIIQNVTSFDKCIFIINSFNNNFVKSSLLAMGIESKNCVELVDRSVQCKKLIVSSKLYDGDAKSLLYLRERLRKKDTESKRVYISRLGATMRRIENEDEVFEVLRKMGFTFVRCEKMSFNEQVNLFSNADFIVGAHGAGMTNALFAKNNAKILEIRNRDYQGLCYYKMCNNLGMGYYNLYGTGHYVKKIEEFGTNIVGNIKVDIKDLVGTLEMMGA